MQGISASGRVGAEVLFPWSPILEVILNTDVTILIEFIQLVLSPPPFANGL